MTAHPMITATHIKHQYTRANHVIDVLHDVTFKLTPATMTALVGPSGAGKSTLLHIVGLLEKPTAGSVRILNQECTSINDAQRTAMRARNIGFVYQFHHLLQGFTAQENIALAHRITGAGNAQAMSRAQDLIKKMNLSHRADHYPNQLSGGEQQRVAIARALANKPKLILADEPTGNLDAQTAQTIFDILYTLCAEEQTTILVATHNMTLANKMHAILHLQNGSISG